MAVKKSAKKKAVKKKAVKKKAVKKKAVKKKAVKKKAVKKKAAAPSASLEERLFTLAKTLDARWKAAGKALERQISPFQIAIGLQKLIDGGDLHSGLLGADATETAIKVFQRGAGLLDDGILGRRTFEMLDTTITGDHDEPDPNAKKVPIDLSTGERRFLYFVDPNLNNKPIGNSTAGNIFANAAFNWGIHISTLLIHETKDSGKANVIITEKNLPGRVLGRANVGGKDNGLQLSLRMDDNQPWNESTYLNTATHEMGHILGLSHVNRRDSIMSRFQNPQIQEPTDFDIQSIQQVWDR